MSTLVIAVSVFACVCVCLFVRFSFSVMVVTGISIQFSRPCENITVAQWIHAAFVVRNVITWDKKISVCGLSMPMTSCLTNVFSTYKEWENSFSAKFVCYFSSNTVNVNSSPVYLV